jgi:hypothetical protein
MSDYQYSKKDIETMMRRFKNEGAGKVALQGVYDNLLNLKTEIEKFYDAFIFYLDYWKTDAPFFGFCKDTHKEAFDRTDYITREITKRFLEIYALILIGLGEETESNSESEKK